MKNKIFLIIYIILAAGLAYWAYPIIKNRYFSQNAGISEENHDLNHDSLNLDETDLGNTEEDEDMDEEEDEEKDYGEDEDSTNEFLEVTNEDCKNKCAEFETGTDQQYCRQICGLTPVKEVDEEDCENLTGLEKDYCLKDLAVANKDFKICQEIKDINIRETCQNRITEEILNGTETE